MKQIATVLLTLVAFAWAPCIAQAQDEGGESKTIVLTDPGHPLNGTWQVVHGAGTVVCPQMTMPTPAGDPETVTISVHDGGARLETTAPSGRMTLQRATADEWESEQQGEMQVLRKKMRGYANWIAWALEGDATIYEGTQTPTAGMTIRYILGWLHGKSDELRGHLISAQQGCKVTRSFVFRRAG